MKSQIVLYNRMQKKNDKMYRQWQHQNTPDHLNIEAERRYSVTANCFTEVSRCVEREKAAEV